jgi:VanZ family protein
MTAAGQGTRRHVLPLRLACAVAWSAAFVVTHLPPSRLPPPGVADYLLHAAGYLVLAVLLTWALAAGGRQLPLRALVAACTMLAYAAFDELTQPLVGRAAEWADALADAAGAALGIAAAETALLLRRRRGGVDAGRPGR